MVTLTPVITVDPVNLANCPDVGEPDVVTVPVPAVELQPNVCVVVL
jgi:hypothetical protein